MDTSPILNAELTDDGNVPLYYQLISVIKRYISAGLIVPGDLLPSEVEMIKSFGISRSTVRQAMGALEDEGLVVRKRGKGTFVAEPKMKRKTENVWSFTSEARAMGFNPSSTLVEFDVITPTPDIVKMLELDSIDTKVYKFTRIRRIDEEPLMLETSFYPEYIYPNLTREQVESSSMYSLLYDVNIIPGSAIDSYEAIKFSQEEAKMLECKAGSVGFFHQRRTKTENGEVFEFTQSLIRGDRARLDVVLKKDGVSFSRSIDGQTNA